MKIVVGITGASGMPYAVKLLQELKGCDVHLVISDSAKQLIEMESQISIENLKQLAGVVYDNSDIGARICSGSFLFDAMVIVPCTMSTLGKLATGVSDNAITRTGSVALKERRNLVIVPRETPLSTIHIENMLRLSQAGAIILPAMPGFYSKPQNIEDLVNFVVSRILDVLGVENTLSPRWDN